MPRPSHAELHIARHAPTPWHIGTSPTLALSRFMRPVEVEILSRAGRWRDGSLREIADIVKVLGDREAAN